MSESPEMQKLWTAMEKDEKIAAETLQKLRTQRDKPIRFMIQTGSGEPVPVLGRRLRDTEIFEIMAALEKINPKLLTRKITETDLTLTQIREVHAVMDDAISLATRLPKEGLNELGDMPIRIALYYKIMDKSQPTEEQMENLKKFRDDA